ncbi:MAG: hypothetical protein AAGA90_07980 [Actinomycetota bacterium]
MVGTLDDALRETTAVAADTGLAVSTSLAEAASALAAIEAQYGADPDWIAADSAVTKARAGEAVARHNANAARAHLEALGALPPEEDPDDPPVATPTGSILAGSAALDGSTLDAAFAVSYLPDDAADPQPAIQRVEWLIDGVEYRVNDLFAPFTLRSNGLALPIDTAFNGEGDHAATSFTLDDGSHTVTVRDVRDGVTATITATFTIDAGSPTGDPDPDPPSGTPDLIVPNYDGGSIGIVLPTLTVLGNAYPKMSDFAGLPVLNGPLRTDTGDLDSFPTEVVTFPDGTTRTCRVIEDRIIDGNQQIAAVWAPDGGSEYVLRRCRIINGIDGLKGSNYVLIEDCLIDSLYTPSGAHSDCFQNSGGTGHVWAVRSIFICRHKNSTNCWRQSSAVGNIFDCWADECAFFGGSNTVHYDDRPGGSITTSGIRNCHLFGKSSSPFRNASADENLLGNYLALEGAATQTGTVVIPEASWRIDL